jgi:hypothetical protein
MSSRDNHRKKSRKPARTKRYTPKHISIPVMKGLRDEFGIVLHSAIAAAELGVFNTHQYDRIGQAINCVWGALELRPPRDSEAAKLVIEGAMRTLNEAGKRGDATGVWELRELERAAILAGIYKAEELLPRMDVNTMNSAIQQFRLLHAEETTRKVFHSPAICGKTQFEGIPA